MNNAATDFEGFSRWLTKLFRPGVATGWTVSQRAAAANMSVDIATGDGAPMTTNTAAWDWTTAVYNIAIGAASVTNRRDIVVAYTDVAVTNPSTGTPNNPGALKFMVVAGTPAASPSDPSDATIQAAVGASNPFLKLARVSLTSSTTQITNAQITSLITAIALNVQRLWGGGSNTLGHLVPNQADGTLVTTTDTDSVTPGMLYFSGATAYRSTAQSITNATFTAVLFDAESADTDTYHSTSSNTSRLTVPATGMYRVTYDAAFAVGAGGAERSFWVAINGAGGASANRYAITSTGPNVPNARNASIDLPLTAGDYVELWCYQDSGGALNTASEATSPGPMRMSIHRLS